LASLRKSLKHLQKNRRSDPQYLVVRYEELIANPQAVMGRTCRSLGVEHSPVLYVQTLAGRPTLPNSSFNVPSGFERIGYLPADRTNTPLENEMISAFSADLLDSEEYLLPSLGQAKKTSYRLRVYAILAAKTAWKKMRGR
jgi:hypothetical protein